MVSAVLAASVCLAGTISDTFNQPQTNCNNNFGPTFSNCDVIGNPLNYDIQKAIVQVTATSIDVTLYFNYGGGISLGGFTDGLQMQVGDLFFYDPANPMTSAYDPNNLYPEYGYGVALTNHDGLVAGDLYQIPNFNALQTADSLLHNTGYYYRRTDPVWMSGTANLVSTGSGVSVVANGNGVSQAMYAATIHIATPSAFLDLLSGGQIGVGFSSAICGNDVMIGATTATIADPKGSVPEPQTFSMFAVGIGLVGCGVWRRRRKS